MGPEPRGAGASGARTSLSTCAFPCCPEAASHRHQPLICSTSSSNVTELLLLGGQAQREEGRASDEWSSSSITSVPNTKGRACAGKRLGRPPPHPLSVPLCPLCHVFKPTIKCNRSPSALQLLPKKHCHPIAGSLQPALGADQGQCGSHVEPLPPQPPQAHSECKSARQTWGAGQGRGGSGLRGGDAPSKGALCSE